MDDFYAARDNTMPSLPWPTIAPPFTEDFPDHQWPWIFTACAALSAMPAPDDQAIRNAAFQDALHIAGQGVKDAHTNEAQTCCNRVYDRIASMIDQPAPRCAECDCEHGGENCNWIDQPVLGSVYGENTPITVTGSSIAKDQPAPSPVSVADLQALRDNPPLMNHEQKKAWDRAFDLALRALTKGDTDD